jgi:succinoglycan biosynthesis transport protein ExoP
METEKDLKHYYNILKSRKKQFIIPAVIVLIVTTCVAILLPSIYESSSTILIEEQQIPPEFVRSTVTGFADQRIQSLTQQILSRLKLWEIIKQFNLYAEMRKKVTQEEVLEHMRNNIQLETVSAQVADRRKSRGKPGVTIAFTISYRGKNPDTVQKVAGNLASLYLEQNLKTREAQAQSTTQFLQSELKELEERIRDLGAKITTFKQEHEGTLPELQQFNLSRADGLESEIKRLDAAMRSAEDRKIYLEGQLATVNPDIAVSGGSKFVDPNTRLKALEVALADLQSKFSEDHPDIRKVRREMAELKTLISQKGNNSSLRQQKLSQLKAELAEKRGKYSDEHPEVKKLKNEIALLEKAPEKASESPQPVAEPQNPAYISLTTQIHAAVNDIASLRQQQAALKEKLQMYRHRLEEIPKVEQEYLALQRDYNNAHTKHQEVMNKILEARIAEGMEEHQKGEKFTLIDPASYPEKPVSPPRMLIFLAGVVLSIGSGLGMVGLSEHLDHSVKSSDDLIRLTGLPVLGSIAKISTAEDVARARRKRKLIWMVTGFSLITGLLLLHFLYMDLWVLTARLFRLASKYS